MPIEQGNDSKGGWYRWGQTGKKYYYKPGNVRSRDMAHAKAMTQARAIEWRKHGGQGKRGKKK